MTAQVNKISKAKARLLFDHPFFATLLLRSEVLVQDHSRGGSPIPFAATDGTAIYYNPEFLEKCTVDDVMAVLAHEVGHDALLHSIRLEERNPTLWNIAGDYAINLMLEEQGFKCPKAVEGGWLIDQKYKGWSADRIYDDLKRECSQQPDAGDKDGFGKPGGQSGGIGDHLPKDGLHGDVLPSPAKDQAEQAAAAQKAKQRVAAAANMARLAGKLRGELARMVDEFLEGSVPWADVLRDFMLQVVKERESWVRRNRRFKQIYLPTRWSRRMGPIVFIPDTSGSMWGDDMEKICSEIAHCAAQTQPSEIVVLWADTQIAGEQRFDVSDFEFSKLEPKGGGGTDMRVPLKHVEEMDPQVVVLMTDGYTPWPDAEPPYPLITLCTTEQACPVGQVIRI